MLTPAIKQNTYLNSGEICAHPLFLRLLNRISQFNSSSPYFILTHCAVLGEELPDDIIPFLQEGLTKIHRGYGKRRFLYKGRGWRIIFTFYPKDEVVSNRYALKNKVSRSSLKDFPIDSLHKQK
mgnify:CR=1 FL=1